MESILSVGQSTQSLTVRRSGLDHLVPFFPDAMFLSSEVTHRSWAGQAASPSICVSIPSSRGSWGFLVSTMLSTLLLIRVLFIQIRHILYLCRVFKLGPSFLTSS